MKSLSDVFPVNNNVPSSEWKLKKNCDDFNTSTHNVSERVNICITIKYCTIEFIRNNWMNSTSEKENTIEQCKYLSQCVCVSFKKYNWC